jgi:hypothetical protein
VGVPTAFGIRPEITGVRAAVADPMHVVAGLFDIVVGKFVEMLTGLPLVSAALNHVEHVRNYANRNKGVTVVVPVDAPGIAGAFGK